ncbi:MAG: site-2 protease family protein [Clostridia bacterium]|nr:site-2 protease family protein [Clostridia bacterium]
MKKRPRIIIRPITAIFAGLLILLDGSMLALLPLLAALCHELGHLAVMLALGVPVREIELTLFGAEIRTPPLTTRTAGTVAVYAAGAAANLLSAAVIFLIPNRSFEAEFFAVCSISLAALNLLPIRSLDGGCILEAVVTRLAPPHMSAILDVVSFVSLFLLWLTAVYLLLICGGNLSLMLFCMYLFVTVFLG